MLTYHYGEHRTINRSLKYGINPSALAQEVGFEKGDKLISINGKPIIYFEDALGSDEMFGEHVTYQVERNGEQVDVTLPKDFAKKFTESGKTDFFTPRQTFYVDQVVPNNSAEKAGLLANDKIVAVDTVSFMYFDEFQKILKQKADSKAQLTVLRNSDTVKLTVDIDKEGKIGIGVRSAEFEYDSIQFGFFESFPLGVDRAIETISMQIKGWGKIFHGDIPANKALQGPIGLAKFYGGEWIWSRFWLFTALISLGLAFMNILPIPALDGGHVVILVIEMALGRALSDKALERIQSVGMVILLSLMVLIFGNDIWQLITR